METELNEEPEQLDKGAFSLPLHEEESFTNYYALVAIFDDGQCLDKGTVIIKVVIQEQGIDVIDEVEILPEVLSTY